MRNGLDEGELRHNGKSAPLQINWSMSQAARIPSTRLPQSWRSSDLVVEPTSSWRAMAL
ncbi:MAG: hypothetical protein ACLT4C_02945 [Butyricicoccus sp.]